MMKDNIRFAGLWSRFLALFIDFVFLEGLFGVTPGKWIAGLRVERTGGGKPGLIKGLLRNTLRVVDGLPAFNILGIILILNSEDKTRYGDRIAGTRVIKVR